jgi:hypothetical protein
LFSERINLFIRIVSHDNTTTACTALRPVNYWCFLSIDRTSVHFSLVANDLERGLDNIQIWSREYWALNLQAIASTVLGYSSIKALFVRFWLRGRSAHAFPKARILQFANPKFFSSFSDISTTTTCNRSQRLSSAATALRNDWRGDGDHDWQ